MDGQATWIMGLIIVFGALALLLLITYSRSTFRRFRAHRLALTCPADGSSVDCIVDKDVTGRRKMEVVTCSRLNPHDDVVCRQRCLDQVPN
jgi:hypothetical protein